MITMIDFSRMHEVSERVLHIWIADIDYMREGCARRRDMMAMGVLNELRDMVSREIVERGRKEGLINDEGVYSEE